MNHRANDGCEGAVEQAREELRRNSRKWTGPRQAILEILGRQTQPLTIKEIQAQLGRQSCDLATVYRSIRLLEKMGLVEKFNFGEATARYRLPTQFCSRHHHHHHLICTHCSEVVEVGECFSADLEKKIAQANGFKGVTHRLEFFGVCPRCQPEKSKV